MRTPVDMVCESKAGATHSPTQTLQQVTLQLESINFARDRQSAPDKPEENMRQRFVGDINLPERTCL